MGRTACTEWTAVRDEWVNRRLAGELLSLKDLASQKDLNYDTLRKRAAADGDVARIAATSVKLAEAGGAIPREDQLPVEPVHPEVAANRAQMKEIEAAVMGLAEWKRQKRADQKADETPVH